MRHSVLIFALLTHAACVQDVNLGLDTEPDTGVSMTADARATTPDASPSVIDAGEANPDSGTAVACTGDSQLCEHCGTTYPPTCVGTTWVCEDRGPCTSCNTDRECISSEQLYCDNNFSTRTGECTPCPDVAQPACSDGTLRTLAYGNGCTYPVCEPESFLDLDPDSLIFFDLPINSIRYAISGYDPVARMCVTAVWFFGGLRDMRAYCGDSDPYVILIPDQNGPCGQWNYNTSVLTNSATGCYDFAAFHDVDPSSPHLDLADLNLSVTSTTFTGNIRIKNRRARQPWPVSFTFRYSTDTTGDSIYIQDRDTDGRQSWVRLYADGVQLPIGRGGCEVEECGVPPLPCPGFSAVVKDIIPPNAYGGSATVNWDGWIYTRPTAGTCLEKQAAHPRTYEVEFCFGRTTTTVGADQTIPTPECQRFPFDYPTTSQVDYVLSEGG